MLLQDWRYYVQQLEREQLRLFHARNIAEEDSVMAKINFYRRKLGQMGARYDEALRKWRHDPVPAVLPVSNENAPALAVVAGAATHDWELCFHSPGDGRTDTVLLKTDDPASLISAIEKRGEDAEIRRDGQYICTMLSDRTRSGASG